MESASVSSRIATTIAADEPSSSTRRPACVRHRRSHVARARRERASGAGVDLLVERIVEREAGLRLRGAGVRTRSMSQTERRVTRTLPTFISTAIAVTVEAAMPFCARKRTPP